MNDALRSECEWLLGLWEARSAGAAPADAMLINRHVRELRAVLNAAHVATLEKQESKGTDAIKT